MELKRLPFINVNGILSLITQTGISMKITNDTSNKISPMNGSNAIIITTETPETLLEKLKLLLVNNTKLSKYKFSDGLKESVANICKKKH